MPHKLLASTLFVGLAVLLALAWPSPLYAAASYEQGPSLPPGRPFDSELLTWQQAMSLERLVVPPLACLDLFERIDAVLEELFEEPAYPEALRRVSQTLLPALIQLLERAHCETDLCLAPEESVVCRALREEARGETAALEAQPALQRLLRARPARTYLTLVRVGLTQHCFVSGDQPVAR